MFRFLPRILEQDERVVLSGEWKHGFFSMAPVAALEVGNIVIYTVCFLTDFKTIKNLIFSFKPLLLDKIMFRTP